jgi:hypothetical protein
LREKWEYGYDTFQLDTVDFPNLKPTNTYTGRDDLLVAAADKKAQAARNARSNVNNSSALMGLLVIRREGSRGSCLTAAEVSPHLWY